MSTPSIEIRDLSKWYGEVIGLAGFSTTIGPGITGLLGQNGAGKSTLFKCLTGLVRPDRGEVRVLGEVPFGNPELFRRVGFCPEQDPFYEDMTGFAFVERVARWAGYPKQEAVERAERALARVDMLEHARKRIGGMSKGMRQRTKFAQAILHEPSVLLLDEPLTGMDPVQRRIVAELIEEYAEAHRLVLVSSHVLHEVETLTDRVLLIREGRLHAEGRVAELRDHFDDVPRRVHVLTDDRHAVARLALTLPHTIGVHLRSEREVLVETRGADEFLDRLTHAAATEGLSIHELYPADEDLAAVFGLLEG
ncbi:MAG: ABC transporter ATP-binding protein [Planctomycetes bacterium]|nr:ABC transporter ATP-binding protein [Planctomycetota bacterium]MCB9890848.1 ABC transporter ATP-binding protein [Planctomycetota bacterium]